MNLYPKLYFNNVTEITTKMLNQYQIKGIILDVDNTLIKIKKKMLPGTVEWINILKQAGIKFYILSNSNKKEKVKKVAEVLGIPYFYFGMKPLKSGFKKVAKLMQLEYEKIGVVGDQIFTDVIGARRCHMYPILVQPIGEKDIWITRIKRPFEQKIIDQFQKKKGEEKK